MPFLPIPSLSLSMAPSRSPATTRAALQALLPWRARRALPGVVVFSGLLLGLPVTPHTMAQMQALNRELGKLCSNPPRQAINVCRIHARLVEAL